MSLRNSKTFVKPSVGHWWLLHKVQGKIKKPSKKVKCEVCGRLISVRTIKTHLKNKLCSKAAKVKTLRNSDYVMIRSIRPRWRHVLDSVGIEITKLDSTELWIERWVHIALMTAFSENSEVENDLKPDIMNAINNDSVLKSLILKYARKVYAGKVNKTQKGLLYLCHPDKEKVKHRITSVNLRSCTHLFTKSTERLLEDASTPLSIEEAIRIQKYLTLIKKLSKYPVTTTLCTKVLETLEEDYEI